MRCEFLCEYVTDRVLPPRDTPDGERHLNLSLENISTCQFSSSERADFGLRLYFQVKITSTFASNRIYIQLGHDRCFPSDRTRRGSKCFGLQTLTCNLDGYVVFSSVLISNWGEHLKLERETGGGGGRLRRPRRTCFSSFTGSGPALGISTVKSAQPYVVRRR